MATEWFVGPIMEKLIDTCFEYIQDQFRWQKGMKKELERLRENHPKIQAVVFAATQAHLIDQNPALNKWIWQLRDAIDEADDVFDEFEYMKHKEKLLRYMDETKVRSTTSSFLFETAQKFRKIGERALKIDPNLNKLEEALQKLDKVSTEVGTFLHLLEGTKEQQQKEQLELYKTRETGSLPKNDLIGRGKEKEFVMQWLRQPTNEEHKTQITGTTLYSNISLLSIVGHGGMGKTTLLQHVYEDEMIQNFDLKMWVCVSNIFDVKKVIADILESLIKKKPELESLDALQGSLKSVVMSKKFLLVLDDIWEEEERDKSKWENVFAPLAFGSLGSKILITTRMNSVASMITKVIKKKKETLRLNGLEKDECLKLLNTHAFAGVDNIDGHKKLRSIAEEIVKKLSGSPLAAKVIGGALNSNLDERHWITILNSDFGSVELGQNDIMPILRLSYRVLPKPLQSCFSFCCIFPQEHNFHKDNLVYMWIAMGFIQAPFNSRESVEDMGGRYFDLLVNKSFFDKVEYGVYYKMHDLLHELAQTVSTQEYFRVVSDETLHYRIPETIRHLSVETNNLEVLRKVGKIKNLRSLFLSYKCNDQDLINVITEIFKALRSIRLLYIFAPSLKEIPEEIGYLIHLRYLNIAEIGATKLPRSLSNLYHLQFIVSYDSMNIEHSEIPFDDFLTTFSDDLLPSDMNNLSHLRYLKLPLNCFPMIHGIGKLKSLQELDEFHVKNEAGYGIGELEHLNELRLLRINLLENVKDVEDACNAKLCDKRNLTDLSLQWNHTENHANPDLEEKVLDNLQPYKSLKKLYINGYIGARSAIWMNNATLITNLEYINLVNCMEWQTLPPFGQLPFLKSLCLSDMPKVKRIENKFHGNDKEGVFPSLEVLYIYSLGAMEDWFDEAAAADNSLFPCLTELHLKDCPNLQELPYLPPKLMKLRVSNVGWKTLNCCNISKSIPLETLHVISCPNITPLLLADEIVRLAALRDLRIEDCPNQISLSFTTLMKDNINPPVLGVGGHREVEATEKCQLMLSYLFINDPSVLLMEPLRSITSLQIMNIQKNDDLVSFPIEVEHWFLKVSSSLYELNFKRLKSLRSLPSTLKSLSSLKILHVEKVPQLQLLPNIPASLERLRLDGLELLQCLPSSLFTSSSLKYLTLRSTPLRELPCLLSLSFLHELTICSAHHLQELPNLPPSLCRLYLEDLDNLNCIPSCFPSLSSLNILTINKVPQLRELLDLPPSLCELRLQNLDNLNYMPSCFPSLSSLNILTIDKVPQLRELLDLPPSLCVLRLENLDNLNYMHSCLQSLSSLQKLTICRTPQLREIPNLPTSLCELHLSNLDNLNCLPSRLPNLCSLRKLIISYNPQLRKLPDLPISLCKLNLSNLDNLECLPSCLHSLSSLQHCDIRTIPHLRKLPDLPPSLCTLHLRNLENLYCVPSCLPSLSSLKILSITQAPQLRKLPDLPPSLEYLTIEDCHPELMKRHRSSGSER